MLRFLPGATARERGLVALCLFAVYVIWGSTYVAMAVGVRHFPPWLLGGLRYSAAGALILVVLFVRGVRWPSPATWRSGAVTGFFLLLVANGSVNLAVTSVSSGLAALVVASSSLFAALFARGFGEPVSAREWTGIGVGFAGVALLAGGGELRADLAGLALLVGASASWAFGSMLSKRLPQPDSVWMASATQLLCGGLAMIAFGFAMGERMPATVPAAGWAAVAYLCVFGAIIAFSAYAWLLKNTRPALATSTAYVNPVIAVGLGALLLGEPVTGTELLAMAVVLAGVVLVTMAPLAPGPDATGERQA